MTQENSWNFRSFFSSVRILSVSGSTRRRAAPKFRRYSAHCSPTGKGVVDDDARQLHGNHSASSLKSKVPVIEVDIAQWLIHCHGVGERSPSSSSTRVRWACKHVRRNRHTDPVGDLQLTKISPAID